LRYRVFDCDSWEFFFLGGFLLADLGLGFDWGWRGGVFGDFTDHFVFVHVEAGAAGVFYGDVEGFEDQVGAAQVDVVAGQGVDDFHERGLDGFLVLDHGDGMKAGVGWSAYSAQHALVEVAELLSAHGGRAALDSGDFDVLAVANILVERHLI